MKYIWFVLAAILVSAPALASDARPTSLEFSRWCETNRQQCIWKIVSNVPTIEEDAILLPAVHRVCFPYGFEGNEFQPPSTHVTNAVLRSLLRRIQKPDMRSQWWAVSMHKAAISEYSCRAKPAADQSR